MRHLPKFPKSKLNSVQRLVLTILLGAVIVITSAFNLSGGVWLIIKFVAFIGLIWMLLDMSGGDNNINGE